MEEKITLPKIELIEGTNTIVINTQVSPSSFKLKYSIGEGGTPDEEITINEYFENKPNDEVKPITAITLRSSEIKAAGQTIYDEEHIPEYGTNELIIEEDYIAYTDELRQAYLQAAKELFGLTYKPLSIDLLGNIYLSFNDIIKVTNAQGETHTTYALNNNHEYNGTLYNTISTPSLSEVEERYKYETDSDTSRRKTAVEIDKANQKITLLETQIGDRSEKTSSITQEIDQIELAVGDLENLTLDVEGTNPLTLENCLEGELIRLNIKGNNTVFDGLKPSDTLVPSNSLVPRGDSKLRIYTKNKCPTSNDDWKIFDYKDGKPYQIMTKEPIEIDNDYVAYFSAKGNTNFVLNAVVFLDENKDVLASFYGWYSRDIKDGRKETEIVFPLNTKYIYLYMGKKVDGEFVTFDDYDIQEIKPMLEYVTKYKNDTTYSGSLPYWVMKLYNMFNYQYYYVTSFGQKADNTTEFEIEYKEFENDNADSVIIGTGNDDSFIFYTKTDGLISEHPYNDKMFIYNGETYTINTESDFLNVRTKLSFKLDATTGNYILKLEDENGHSEEFEINSTTEFESTNDMTLFSNNSNDTRCNIEFYSIKVWKNQTLVTDGVPARRKSNSRIGFYDKVANLIWTWGNYSGPGTSGLEEFIAPETSFQNYNNQVVDLGILEPLRQLNANVYDEFNYDAEYLYNSDTSDNNKGYKAIVTRRVGVTSSGELYELTNPIYEILDIPDILLVEGINYIDFYSNYTANMKATYVQINSFTKIFATQYEVTSQILQLANQITLLVTEKVGEDEIIAKINLAVQDEQGIIDIFGNQIKIKSDNFELTADGKITARAGEIAGLEMIRRELNTGGNLELWSILQKVYGDGSNYYLNGLMIPDESYGRTFIVAGMPTDQNGENWSTGDAPFRLLSDGTVFAKNIYMNGEGGNVEVTFNSGRRAMWLSPGCIYFYIDDQANNFFGGLSKNNSGFTFELLSGYDFSINDFLHNIVIATFRRQDDQGNPAVIKLWQKTYYYAGTSSGSEIATKDAICDKNVKKNITESKANALDRIDKIEFKQFDWDEEKIDRKGHVDIGIIAQQVKEIDDNYIDNTSIQRKNGENTETTNLYSINVLNMLTTTMKAVQELNQKVEEQEKTIKELQDEIDELKKGDK